MRLRIGLAHDGALEGAVALAFAVGAGAFLEGGFEASVELGE